MRAVVAALLLAAGIARAQAPALRWAPERPVQGTLFRLTLAGADSASVSATVAGEAVHFAPSAGALRALAAVPIDSSGSVGAVVVVRRAGGADTLRVRIPVAAGRYPTERLRVAPRFGAEPDSALQRRIADEARRAAEVSRAAHDTPRLWRGEFRRPRPGRVTSGFGRARVFNGAVASRHMGTDFAGAVGAPVRAAARGVVRLTGGFYYGGNVVYVDHGAGLVTAYLHLSETLVAPGDTVEQGALLGRVGATGRVTGPHLHWIARYGTVTVDPMSLLRVTAAP